MGTRRNFASLSFRSEATRGSEDEFGCATPVPFWLRIARGKTALAKRETAVAAKRSHFGGMASAFYQSFTEELYSGTAMKKDNRNLFSRLGFDRTMQESSVTRCRTTNFLEA